MYGYFTESNYRGAFPYTDLACERRKAAPDVEGIDYRREKGICGVWERIKVSSAEGARIIGRPTGIYNTLHLCRMDMLDTEGIADASDEIARELCYIFDASDIFPERILVCGLGNPHLTPDSLGVDSARAVKPTMHIRDFDRKMFDGLNCAEIAVFSPGVAATSGMDASVAIRGLCQAIGPDAVIAIDALAARSSARLGTTVQICNTGIAPGSGIGNPRSPISKETVGVPVIAVGVPTVIDSRMLCQRFDDECPDKRAEMAPMFVSPKEINEIVSAAAQVIGGGINQAFGIFN